MPPGAFYFDYTAAYVTLHCNLEAGNKMQRAFVFCVTIVSKVGSEVTLLPK